MKRLLAIFVAIMGLGIFSQSTMAQSTTTGANYIATGVPFLTIAPDSRAGAMGDAGVATSPDMNSQHWNPSKYAFIESEMGVGLSYTPWLRNLVDDINLAYLVGYKKLDDMQTVSASLRYFSLGDITFMSEYGEVQGQQSPNEFAFDVAYTRLLSENFSGGVALRYIRSDLTGGQLINGVESHAGNSYAADISFYYQNEFRVNRKESVFSAGINISNIGAKISYTEGATKDFIPTNLRLGAGYKTELDTYNTISFNVDLNKLLVPTPSLADSIGGDGVIVGGGFSEDKSVIAGMFSSFGDAPGGFKEELQEINVSLGVEYVYNEQFALRAGYFYENENKGNRKFLTAGAGLKLNVFALDFSYLVPTERNHPLENTLRFSLSFDFEAFNRQRR
ncbi:type IX secretion system outer membrane channel protein PorV [Sunxiuqinia sp. A32]|uniref:type IX secretion system outer membrane channel protein PorV n=1 Tax=Sunxiuqinia sp. A32 TaxID=3461496 RepID=UPI0040461B11